MMLLWLLLPLAPGLFAAAHHPHPPPAVRVHLALLQWTPVPLPAPGLYLTAHQAWNQCFWVAGKDAMIASSCDGGRTWKMDHWHRHGHWIFRLAFAGSKSAYAFGTGQSEWRSRDGGMRWRRVKNSTIPVQFAAFDAQGDGIVASLKKIAYRLGGEKIWHKKTMFVDAWPVTVIAVAILDASRAAVLMQSVKFAHVIYSTQDGGKTWQEFTFPPALDIDNMRPAPDQYVVIGHQKSIPFSAKIITSRNGAQWRELNSPAERILSTCSHGVVCSQGKYLAAWRLRPGTFLIHAYRTPGKLHGFNSARQGDVLCRLGTELHCGLMRPVQQAVMAAAVTQQKIINQNWTHHLKLVRVAGRRHYFQERFFRGAVVLYAKIARTGKLLPLREEFAPTRLMARLAMQDAATVRYKPVLKNGKPVAIYVSYQRNYE